MLAAVGRPAQAAGAPSGDVLLAGDGV